MRLSTLLLLEVPTREPAPFTAHELISELSHAGIDEEYYLVKLIFILVIGLPPITRVSTVLIEVRHCCRRFFKTFLVLDVVLFPLLFRCYNNLLSSYFGADGRFMFTTFL